MSSLQYHVRFSAAGLLLVSCTSGNDTGDCDSTDGSISGIVYEDYSWDDLEIAPANTAKIVIQQGENEPITALSDEEGNYSLTLEAGHWELDAYTQAENCLSMEDYEVDLYACQGISLDLLIETCLL
jgi:hypothetical protein